VTLRRPPAEVGRFPGTPVSFVVMNRAAAETVVLDEPHILISIHARRATPPEHPPSPARLARLRVVFDDVGYELLEALDDDSAWGGDDPPEFFDAPQAQQIRAFVEEHRAATPLIVCHCEAGMSRSPAVAAALSRWLNGNDDVTAAITHWIAIERLELDEEIVFWNRLVHDRLLAVLNES
jgi:predicted protein tyrosine phosphatase